MMVSVSQHSGQRRESCRPAGFGVVQTFEKPTEAKTRKVMRMATHRPFSVPEAKG